MCIRDRLVVQRAGVGPFGALAAQHVVLRGGELGAPLRVGQRVGIGLPRLGGVRAATGQQRRQAGGGREGAARAKEMPACQSHRKLLV